MAAEQHPGGHDALMAAITGEPLPPGSGADARGEYRSATADVALLREQLDVLGRALSEPPPGPRAAGAVRRPSAGRPRRRPLRVALGALAAACAGVVVTGLGWLVVQGAGGTAQDAASGKAAAGTEQDASAPGQEAAPVFGTPRYLACARLVAEGTVTGAEPVPGAARHRVTLEVTRSYRPEKGTAKPEPPERTTFVLDDATARLRPGDRVLIGILRDRPTPDTVITGERHIATARTRVTGSLPESRTLTCD
ncbi:hypothetical protein [Streptomyces pactum]|uniref:Uncharacterized protein n=1 Tax=Streptomyces pactum TaxID=68249 RepID=A0A1S6JCU4_9ACTN|nr:hypothetical protein [Streptomyces pactum]AQS69578.1 hypothetical protein B1H29_24190 [Streptomyces pactum]